MRRCQHDALDRCIHSDWEKESRHVMFDSVRNMWCCVSCWHLAVTPEQAIAYLPWKVYEHVDTRGKHVNMEAARKIQFKEKTVKTLIMMVGLPRSGKSTVARAEAYRLHAPIVCPDDIRLALHGRPYLPSAEGFVWATAKLMVRALFKSHDVVILDACNNTVKRRDEWADSGWQRKFLTVGTPMDTCLARTEDENMKGVIMRMASAHEPIGYDEEEL